MITRQGWVYDGARNAWDHSDFGCVARDAAPPAPWCAYHSGRAFADSRHRTMREAMAACEATHKEPPHDRP
jgi:hypothetical protein